MEAGETIIFPELMERGTHVGELGPEDACPHFRGCYVQASCVPIREVSSFQLVLCTGFMCPY